MRRLLPIAVIVCLLPPRPAVAQGTTFKDNLRSVFGTTFSDAEFDSIARIFAADLATFPVGSSSGAFTWESDPNVGTFTRHKSTFGPWFAERATTTGRRGAFGVGFAYQHTPYRKLEDLDLRSGEIITKQRRGNLNTTNFVFGPGFSDPVETSRVSMKLTVDTFTMFGTAALSKKLDVSVVVPIQRLHVNAQNPSNQLSPTALKTLDTTQSGIGDVTVRGKYLLAAMKSFEMAPQVEVRFPTGDQDKLLGTGETLARVMFIASSASNTFAPHVNIGYLFGRGGARVSDPNPFPAITQADVSSELDFTFGVEVAPHQKLTVSGDIVGRRLHDVARFGIATYPFRSIFCNAAVTLCSESASAATPLRAYDDLGEGLWAQQKNVDILFASIGGKYNLWGNALVNVNALFPMKRRGFTPNFTTVFGLEYAF